MSGWAGVDELRKKSPKGLHICLSDSVKFPVEVTGRDSRFGKQAGRRSKDFKTWGVVLFLSDHVPFFVLDTPQVHCKDYVWPRQ